MNGRRLVVVGNGMAGMRLVDELQRRAPDRYAVTVVGAEPRPCYNRVLLSALLAGDAAFDSVVLYDRDWYARRGITLLTGRAAVHIDRDARRLELEDGSSLDYDALVLAVGSRPIRLNLPGDTLEGVHTFRSADDVEHLIGSARPAARAVVIGGGLLGLEAAHGLQARGMHVTVVHLAGSLMERQLDAAAAEMLRRVLLRRGLNLRLGARTEAIVGRDRVEGIRLASGETLPADLIVMAVGVQPECALARDARLDCGRGIRVDDTLATSDPRIFAVGECIEHEGRTYGLVAPVYEQAGVLADVLAGDGGARYRGSLAATSLKVSGIHVFSAGNFLGGDQAQNITLQDGSGEIYKKLVVDEGRLIGAVFFGEVSHPQWYQELIASGRAVTAFRDRVMFGPDVADAASFSAAA